MIIPLGTNWNWFQLVPHAGHSKVLLYFSIGFTPSAIHMSTTAFAIMPALLLAQEAPKE